MLRVGRGDWIVTSLLVEFFDCCVCVDGSRHMVFLVESSLGLDRAYGRLLRRLTFTISSCEDCSSSLPKDEISSRNHSSRYVREVIAMEARRCGGWGFTTAPWGMALAGISTSAEIWCLVVPSRRAVVGR
ncbi:hypothetical protein F4804DRAFT_17324 [Jackrogersella minutella]|nr:hypothetical protein F4804DRAFT_17324 [Jackrogersella minutella]